LSALTFGTGHFGCGLDQGAAHGTMLSLHHIGLDDVIMARLDDRHLSALPADNGVCFDLTGAEKGARLAIWHRSPASQTPA